jgi:hypothetical protein
VRGRIVVLSAAMSAAPAALTDPKKQLDTQLLESQRQGATANVLRAEEARAAQARAAQLQSEANAREVGRRQPAGPRAFSF